MLISKKQFLPAFQKEFQKPIPKDMTAGKAAETMQKYFTLMDTADGDILGPDGKISRHDMEAILTNPGAPQELKDAAKFFLKNKASFEKVDTGGWLFGLKDGLMSRDELRKFAHAEAQRSKTSPSNPGASGGYGCGCGAASGNGQKSISDILKMLANIMDKGQANSAGDTSATGGTSGTGSADQPKKKMDFTSAMKTIKKHFKTVDNGSLNHWQKTGDGSLVSPASFYGDDGLVTKGDLQAILRDPDQPQELRDACAYLLNHPKLFGEIDGATAILGHRDGLIDLNDLDKIIAKYSGNG